ncbi:PEP-CTERM sorting domain-containing protein [Aquincola sp. MAHUQ-54]|uniref:PEP-CTERM sorting domain-containing protein n=1 Tax=Aquincola agrisoli TaxID=3119538 RepID=A0AAW9Q9V4_9BURK
MKKLCAQSAAAMAAACLFGVAAPGVSVAGTLTIDVSSIASAGEFLGGANPVFQYDIGANSVVKAVSYDVVLQAYEPSWLSELGAAFTDSSTLNGFLLRPAFGTNAAGSGSFAGSIDLAGGGLGFAVGADGMLRVEFAEDAYDGLTPDGLWRSGAITVEFTSAVPEPGTYALMALGLAGIYLSARRRPRAAA